MIARCLGGWTDDAHAPVLLGEKYPLSNATVTDTACDRCARAMRAPIVCRLCGNVETTTGLCDRCDLKLEEHQGEPAFHLTVYRAGAEPLSCAYDGVGAASRLRAAWKDPAFCGFALRPLTRAA